MADRALGVSVIQAGAVAFDTAATLDKFEQFAVEAAQRARFAVFPEAFVGGYPKGLDFGARVGTRSEAGREESCQPVVSRAVTPGLPAGLAVVAGVAAPLDRVSAPPTKPRAG